MNRLINTSFALVLATLLSPALALESRLSVTHDAGNELLEREIDRLGQRQDPLSAMEADLTRTGGARPQRDVTLLASRKHKDRDYGHYKPSKGKRHYPSHRGHSHDYGHHYRHDHGHIHYYRPIRYWGYDRYYDYYDGVNLNLILHLD